MDGEQFSCVKQVTKTVQLSLPMLYISNEFAGIIAVLDTWKRQYVKQLHGVVVSYRNVSLPSPYGAVSDQRAYVVYNVSATFDVFCPVIGEIVKGKIKRVSSEHLGCLIEDTINVTIRLPRDPPCGLSKFIYLDGDVLFEITQFINEPKFLRVNGDITPRCIELMDEMFPVEDVYTSFVDEASVDVSVDMSVLTPSKKKKKKRDKVSIPVKIKQEVMDSPGLATTKHSGLADSPKVKDSSSKKRKRESLDLSENPMDMKHSSLSSSPKVKVSSSKKKKRESLNSSEYPIDIKQEALDSGDSPKVSKLNHSIGSPKKHKKKKTESVDSPVNIKKEMSEINSILNMIKKTDEMSMSSPKTAKVSKKRKRESSGSVDTLMNNIQGPKKTKKKDGKSKDASKKSKKKGSDVDSYLENLKFEANSVSEDSKVDLFSMNMDFLNSIKNEAGSTEEEQPKKKKKHTKISKEGSKAKDKKKASKKKGKIVAPGEIVKKDKKKSKKGSKKDDAKKSSNKKDEHSKKSKSKKDNKKDKSENRKNKKLKLANDLETDVILKQE